MLFGSTATKSGIAEWAMLLAAACSQTGKTSDLRPAPLIADNGDMSAEYSCDAELAVLASSARQWSASHGWQSDCVSPCTLLGPVETACPPASTRVIGLGNITELIARGQEAWVRHGGTAMPTHLRGKVLRIRAPVLDGFWTRALFAVQQASWAALNHIPCFIELNVNGAPCGEARACDH